MGAAIALASRPVAVLMPLIEEVSCAAGQGAAGWLHQFSRVVRIFILV
jgi:hypothetical protein